MVNIKHVRCPGQAFFWSMATILGDVVVARRTRPRAMPLATMTMKTQTHGFLNFYSRTVVMGFRSAALWAAGELRYYVNAGQSKVRYFSKTAVAEIEGMTTLLVWKNISEINGSIETITLRSQVKLTVLW